MHLNTEHARLSPTCPLILGLCGDNRPLDEDALLAARQYAQASESAHGESDGVVGTCVATHMESIELICTIPRERYLDDPEGIVSESRVMVAESVGPLGASTAHIAPSTLGIENAMGTYPPLQANMIPRIDEMYFEWRAAFEVEPFTSFHVRDCDLDVLLGKMEAFTPPEGLLDLLAPYGALSGAYSGAHSGSSVMHPQHAMMLSRLGTFEELDWRAQGRVSTPTPEDLASAGFYYEGTADNCRYPPGSHEPMTHLFLQLCNCK